MLQETKKQEQNFYKGPQRKENKGPDEKETQNRKVRDEQAFIYLPKDFTFPQREIAQKTLSDTNPATCPPHPIANYQVMKTS